MQRYYYTDEAIKLCDPLQAKARGLRNDARRCARQDDADVLWREAAELDEQAAQVLLAGRMGVVGGRGVRR